MKGDNEMIFCEEQMCEIVHYWLVNKLSSHGEFGAHYVSEFCDNRDKIPRPTSSFRITLTPKPKEETK